MLNQQKSPKAALLKYGLFLPLFALGLVSFLCYPAFKRTVKRSSRRPSHRKTIAPASRYYSGQPAVQGWDDFYPLENET